VKLWHISDTHGLHSSLKVPTGIDIVIHSGDASNFRDPWLNKPELDHFLKWFSKLEIKHKIFVPGNHDTSLEKGLISRDLIESLGIHLLINEEVVVEGLRIWGSPHVPRYGDWAYMKPRGTINRVWEGIPEGLDILVTHGPPKSILDATYNEKNEVELIGDGALFKEVMKKKPKYMLFGHCHSVDDIRNAGCKILSNADTFFSNGSCCDDGKMDAPTSNGNVITLII